MQVRRSFFLSLLFFNLSFALFSKVHFAFENNLKTPFPIKWIVVARWIYDVYNNRSHRLFFHVAIASPLQVVHKLSVKRCGRECESFVSFPSASILFILTAFQSTLYIHNWMQLLSLLIISSHINSFVCRRNAEEWITLSMHACVWLHVLFW